MAKKPKAQSDAAEVRWEDALSKFLRRIESTRAEKTFLFYRSHLTQIVRWCDERNVPFSRFRAAHLDDYLLERQKSKLKPATVRHDAVAVKAFFRFCQRERLLLTSPLSEYEIRSAPEEQQFFPENSHIIRLLAAMQDRWSLSLNPSVKFFGDGVREFFIRRNTAIVLLCIDGAARIGEVLSLNVLDFEPEYTYLDIEDENSPQIIKASRVRLRETKGRTARDLPLRPVTAQAINTWLQSRVDVAYRDADEGPEPTQLFLGSTGEPMAVSTFCREFKGYVRFAGLPDAFTTHAFRRFSVNRVAQKDFWAAVQLAGHKDPKVTKRYLKFSFSHVHRAHQAAGAVESVTGRGEKAGVIVRKKTGRRKI